MSEETFVLTANTERVVRVPFKVFACISATAAFNVVPDHEDTRTISTGIKFGNPLGRTFKRIRFVETSGADNTIHYYAGDDDYDTKSIANSILSTTANIANDISNCVQGTPLQFVNTNANAGTPKAFRGVSTFFRKAKVIAQKSLDGFDAAVANAGNVVIGPSGTVGQQPMILAPGDEVILECPLGAKWNFTAWYFDVANAGDGIVVIYN